MKAISNLLLAALCIGTSLSACKKEAPLLENEKQSMTSTGTALTVLDSMKPNWVYTLVGNPNIMESVDGVGTEAGFFLLNALVAKDGYLYAVADNLIRKISISDRTVTTLAGNPKSYIPKDGLGNNAGFSSPTAIALGPDGNLYITESNTIRKVTMEGMVTTIKPAKLGRLTSIAVAPNGSIYVTDYDIGQIRKISTSGVVSTFTSGGPNGSESRWNFRNVVFSPDGVMYAAGSGVYKINKKGSVTTLRKNLTVGSNGLLALGNGTLYLCARNQIQKLTRDGNLRPFAGLPYTDPWNGPAEGPADRVDLLTPSGLVIENGVMYFAVHPNLRGDPEYPENQGHLIQMIKMPLSPP